MRQINLVFVIGIMMISKIVAFQSLTTNVKSSTQLDMTMNRRDAWKTIGAAVVTTLLVSEPSYGKSSTFFYDDKIEEKPPEASQLPTGGKVDLNSAFVVRMYATFCDNFSLCIYCCAFVWMTWPFFLFQFLYLLFKSWQILLRISFDGAIIVYQPARMITMFCFFVFFLTYII